MVILLFLESWLNPQSWTEFLEEFNANFKIYYINYYTITTTTITIITIFRGNRISKNNANMFFFCNSSLWTY